MTPETLYTLTNPGAAVLTSVYLKTLLDLDFHFEAVPAFRSCEFPAACTILCTPEGSALGVYASPTLFTF